MRRPRLIERVENLPAILLRRIASAHFPLLSTLFFFTSFVSPAAVASDWSPRQFTIEQGTAVADGNEMSLVADATGIVAFTVPVNGQLLQKNPLLTLFVDGQLPQRVMVYWQTKNAESKLARVEIAPPVTGSTTYNFDDINGWDFTNNDNDKEIINSIRLHGKGSEKYDNVRIGLNSRLDTIQAAILLEKIKIFPNELKSRDFYANLYQKKLNQQNYFKTPKIKENTSSAWAQFTLVVENRNALQNHLKDMGIPSVVYYPIALSKQLGYDHLPVVSSGVKVSEWLSEHVLSLPMHPYMTEELIERVCKGLESFNTD